MDVFNAFWTSRLPDLKPTAGYPLDALRFRQAIDQLARDLGSIRISGGEGNGEGREHARLGVPRLGRQVEIGLRWESQGGEPQSTSSLAVNDPALLEVVRRDFDGHPVTRNDADEVLAHLAGDVGQNAVAIFQLDHELGIGQSLDNLSFGSDRFFFGHKDLL